MTVFAVPKAPLSHASETEHRRLIASRANAVDYERGVITPTFDFTTTGDLSNAYTTQSGYYWRIGHVVHFIVHVNVTPTFSTSSGSVLIGGLPYPQQSPYLSYHAVRLSGTGITWPGSDVVGHISDGEQQLRIVFQGTGAAGQQMAASDMTSATLVGIIITGFYPIDSEAV